MTISLRREAQRQRDIMIRSSAMFATVKKSSEKYDAPINFDLEFLRTNMRLAIAAAYNCPYCGVKITVKNVSLDHATPLARGGTSNWNNIILCCKGCNKAKGSMTRDEFALFMCMLDEHMPSQKDNILRTLKIGASFRFGKQRRDKQ